MVDITEIDIQILQFVSSRDAASLESIKSRFPKVLSIEYRVKLLSTPEYKRFGNLPISNPVPNSSYLSQDYGDVMDGNITKHVPLDRYRLTDSGRKFLQDNIRTTKSERRELWIKNAWIPILVTLATNLVISGVKWLFPLLTQWLASFHG